MTASPAPGLAVSTLRGHQAKCRKAAIQVAKLQRTANSDVATACFPVNCPTVRAPGLSIRSGTGRAVGFVGSVKPVYSTGM